MANDVLRAIRIYVVDHRKNQHESGLAYWLKKMAIPVLLSTVAGPIMLAYGDITYTSAVFLRILVGILALAFLSYATLMLNDICDRDVDVIVHPERPLPLGMIQTRDLLIASMLFYAFALGVSLLLGWICFLAAFLEMAVSVVHYGYTKRNLKVPGSPEVLTTLQWAIVPAFCYAVAGSHDYWSLFLLIFFLFSAYLSFHIGDGIKDREGDGAYGVHTIAVTMGVPAAANVSFVLFLISLAAGILLWSQTALSAVFLFLFLFVAGITIQARFSLLRDRQGNDSSAQKRFHTLTSRYFMLTLGAIFVDRLFCAAFS